MRRPLFAVALALALAACGKTWPPLQVPDGCQPLLGGSDCFMPYPSDFFQTGDAIVTKGAARLSTFDGNSADVAPVIKQEAYSRLSRMIFSFPVAMSAEGFTKIADDPTTRGNTLIVDAET